MQVMWLGIDLGTGSLKAAVMDEAGRVVASARAAYSLDTPQAGWCQIDPKRWWRATLQATRKLPDEVRSSVGGIGFSGQMHGVVMCNENGEALAPAILWPDRRAQLQLDRYPNETLRLTGNVVSPGMAGPMLLWLCDNQDEVYRRARWALQPKDWLRMQLAGQVHTDASDATGTLLTDVQGQWHYDLVSKLGLRSEILPTIVQSYAISGGLTKSAALKLGLKAGIPVIVGAGDTAAAIIGNGLRASSQAQLTIGTGAQIVLLTDTTPQPSSHLNVYRAADVTARPQWYTMAAMQNGGLALDWVRRTLKLDWQRAHDMAFDPTTASDGLVFLPYLSGERTPLMAPHARGGWVGLSTEHSPGSLMRAGFLGVAFSIRAGLEAMQQHGLKVSRLRLSGGGTVDVRWRALLARVLNMPMSASCVTDASARGAAMLAALGAGESTQFDHCYAIAQEVEPIVPQSKDAKLDQDYARFQSLYQHIEPWFLSGHSSKVN